jgi:hypothetical protein
VCVCVCVCVCIHTHTQPHVYIYIYTYKYIRVHTRTPTHTFIVFSLLHHAASTAREPNKLRVEYISAFLFICSPFNDFINIEKNLFGKVKDSAIFPPFFLLHKPPIQPSSHPAIKYQVLQVSSMNFILHNKYKKKFFLAR